MAGLHVPGKVQGKHLGILVPANPGAASVKVTLAEWGSL